MNNWLLIQHTPTWAARQNGGSICARTGWSGFGSINSEEYERFDLLNQTYKQKFGFPFMIAVKHHTKSSILKAFELRLKNTVSAEMTQSLTELPKLPGCLLVQVRESTA